MPDGFAITARSGFHITLGDYTPSVQFGHGNYCSRMDYSKFGPETERIIKSPDCEIAIWLSNESGEWVTEKVVRKVLKETLWDCVMGEVTPLQVGRLITWMTKQAQAKLKIKKEEDS